MPFYSTDDGAEIHYEVIEGVLPKDTMFVHGNMASRRWWYPSEAVWRQKSNWQDKGAMILVEFRGCGKSSAPRGQDDVCMSLFARDFTQLARTLGRGKLNLVGHSTGGLIASLMLAQAPDLFERAVLLDPVGATGVVFRDGMTEAFEQMKTNKDLVAVVLGSTIKDHNPQDPYFQDVIVEDAFHAANTVGDRVLKALHGLDSRKNLSGVHQPILVLHGEHDTLLPMAESQALASLLNAKFEVLPGQGHCANVENPQKFVDAVHPFLFEH